MRPVRARRAPRPCSSPAASGRYRDPLKATLSAPARQTLKVVRKRGLLVRFRGSTAATWTLTATLRKVAKQRAARLQTSHGRLARTTFKARSGSGTLRLRIPAARLKGMRAVVIRVQARVQANGKTVQRSLMVRVGA